MDVAYARHQDFAPARLRLPREPNSETVAGAAATSSMEAERVREGWALGDGVGGPLWAKRRNLFLLNLGSALYDGHLGSLLLQSAAFRVLFFENSWLQNDL